MLLTMFCVFAASSGKSAYPNLVLGLTQQDCFATMRVGDRSTLASGKAAPVSFAAFLCSTSFMGQMSLPARAAAWLATCFEHLSHPMSVEGQGVDSKNSARSIAMSKPTVAPARALSFNHTQFNVIERNAQTWLTSSEIAQALGYARPDSVNKIYERNKDEFPPDMTSYVKLTLQGDNQQRDVRIFSLRGAHLVGMFARTPIAKDFRKWVLDILDKEASSNHQLQKPEKPKNMLRGKVHKLQHACEFICGSLEMRVRIPDTLWQNHPLREGDQIYFEYPHDANPMIATPIAIHTNKEEACTSQSK